MTVSLACPPACPYMCLLPSTLAPHMPPIITAVWAGWSLNTALKMHFTAQYTLHCTAVKCTALHCTEDSAVYLITCTSCCDGRNWLTAASSLVDSR